MIGTTYRRRVTAMLFAVGAALMAAAVAATAWAPPAQAHDHRILNTVLKKGAQDLQTGLNVVESEWHCQGYSGDTPPYAALREIEDLGTLIDEAGGSALAFETNRPTGGGKS